MPQFEKVVNKVIEKCDIILEVLDARFIEETRNKNIEKRAKILIHVINKCDYVEKSYLDEIKKQLENCVFVSAKRYFGIALLKKKIMQLAQKNKIKKPIVGVLGYPNVGKSSIINVLKGKKSARTSKEAGFTKGQQYLNIGNSFLMIDTPGVIPKRKNNEQELVIIGAKNPYSIGDPDLAVITLLEKNPGLIEKAYGVEKKSDKEETIKDIALKLNFKKKGNLPDFERASRVILQDWFDGKIKE